MKRTCEACGGKGEGPLVPGIISVRQTVCARCGGEGRLPGVHNAKWYADAIFEALHRERPTDGQERYAIMLAVLEGCEMKEQTCPKCGGGGRVKVQCESSGGSFYMEDRQCPGAWDRGCQGTGKVRRLMRRNGQPWTHR